MMEIVTLFDWNILAPMYIDMSEYTSVNGDTNLLHEKKRLLLVIHRIKTSNADIVTLQEVQKDQYEALQSELSDKYVSLGLASHQLSYWTNEWLKEGEKPQENGQVTFLRKGMFEVIEQEIIQTTDDGNRLQIAVLKYRADRMPCIILVNLHLESGMDDWKHVARKQQVAKIHKEVEKRLLKLSDLKPYPILVGDFNTFGDQLGMKEIRQSGYVDVAETLGKERPTFIVVTEDDYQVTLDHVVLRKADVDGGRVRVKAFEVPDLSSQQYNSVTHRAVIIDALSQRLQRKNLSFTEGLKTSDEALDIVSHILPSSANFTESDALKALRVGSDHLPLYVELELSHT